MQINDLDAYQVQAYYADYIRSGLSAQSVLHIHRLLSQTLKQAVRWGMLQRNALDGVTPPPRRKPELRSLSADEARTLLRSAEATDYIIPIHLAIFTGLRRSEALGLRWRDIDLDERKITVSRTMVDIKGNPTHIDEPKSRRSGRVVAISEDTSALLRSHRERRTAQLGRCGEALTADTQVCVRSDGRVMKPDTLTNGFKRIARQCGILDIRYHDLRHTHASILLSDGAPVHVVQARMGHASIQTTVDIYGHVLSASDVEAGDKLDSIVGRMWAEEELG